MRKHIYLHTSNLTHASQIAKDKAFEPLCTYQNDILFKVYRNEFGRIKTSSNYFHIMLGTITDDNCPWCGSVPTLVDLNEPADWTGQARIKFYMQCLNCGSTGPVNTITFNDITDFEIKEHVKQMIKHKYSERKQWDHDLEIHMPSDS